MHCESANFGGVSKLLRISRSQSNSINVEGPTVCLKIGKRSRKTSLQNLHSLLVCKENNEVKQQIIIMEYDIYRSEISNVVYQEMRA